MNLTIIEASNGFNHGKFGVGLHTRHQWQRTTSLPDVPAGRVPLLGQLGWGPRHLWVLDLQTGEGAMFAHGGHAPADLDKHRIWVCPLFEPFLTWLYTQPMPAEFDQAHRWLDTLPGYVDLPQAPADMHGYRRRGPAAASPHSEHPTTSLADRKTVTP